MRLLFCICLLLMLTPKLHAQLVGTWYGKAGTTHYILDIRTDAQGYYALLDIPQEQLLRLKADSLSFVSGKLFFSFNGLKLRFSGKLKKRKIGGTFLRDGNEHEFLFQDSPIPARTQWDLSKPTYKSKEVRFMNKDANIKLAGTLTLPKGKGQFPAVVLITGSGPQDRNEEALGHRPFQVIADYLTSRGVAVLRYDDRGVAESEGNFRPASLEDYAEDASAAVDFLKAQPMIDTSKIGLLGHSEGGNVAPLLTGKRDDISFMILLAAPVSNLDMMLLQLEYIYQDDSPEFFDRDVPHWRKIYRAMARINDRKELRDTLTVLFDAYEADIKDDAEFAPFGGREAYKKSQIARHSSLWYQSFVQFDGSKYLEKLSMPILALNGTRDRQVDAEQNLGAMEKIFEGKTNFRSIRVDNASHFFQSCETCNLLEMYFIPETFSASALEEITQWLRDNSIIKK